MQPIFLILRTSTVDFVLKVRLFSSSLHFTSAVRFLFGLYLFQIQFHVMLLGTSKESEFDDHLHAEEVGEIEIERISTRIVEVRRKDLVPVIERLQKFTKVQGAR